LPYLFKGANKLSLLESVGVVTPVYALEYSGVLLLIRKVLTWRASCQPMLWKILEVHTTFNKHRQ